MKIIGNDENWYTKTYILTATETELKNLMGYGHYDNPKGIDDHLRTGGTIPISPMYDRLYRMANMERELTEISAKLKAASDFVNTALPVITHIKGEESA